MVLHDQRKVSTDVMVIGGGGAGLRAAIASAQSGARVLLVSLSRIGYENNTAIAFGNMCIIVKPDDNPQVYLEDTMLSGRFINDQILAEILADETAYQVQDLEQLGVSFVRKDGALVVGSVPGHSYPRSVSAVKRGLGFSLPLRARAEAMGVSFLEGLCITKLVSEGKINGAIGIDIYGVVYAIEAKSVILATGGLGQIYLNSTNAASTAGDGYALAYEAMTALRDMEMVQFYPTATIGGATKHVVFYEFIIGQSGGVLRNADGDDVLERYGFNNTASMTRDRLSRVIMTELTQGRGINGALELDLSSVTTDALARLENLLPKHAHTNCMPSIPVAPAAHFQMGGIMIDRDCKTEINGLFAAGEVCGGVHGANRLGGNSLTEVSVFGKRAGIEATLRALEQPQAGIRESVVKAEVQRLLSLVGHKSDYTLTEIRNQLRNTMWRKSGIIRSNRSLSEALDDISQLHHHLNKVRITGPEDLIHAVRLHNMIIVSEMVVRSALLRTESRGAHFREDYPEENDQQRLINTVVRKENQNMVVKCLPLLQGPASRSPSLN